MTKAAAFYYNLLILNDKTLILSAGSYTLGYE